MTRILTILSLAAAAALAGCNNEDHTIVAGPGADEEPVANAGTVVLPPAIAASKTYRCKDNSLVSIDWLSDGTARIKGDQPGTGTTVTPADAASPLKGDPQAATVTYNGQSCKA